MDIYEEDISDIKRVLRTWDIDLLTQVATLDSDSWSFSNVTDNALGYISYTRVTNDEDTKLLLARAANEVLIDG